ncbi:EthD domain-containing protein [Burkholderia multivorans]|uniref:EthD domain-containing protein n=1 Tax=Burkholderia multivorans TaxID=87883 RepID=UPI001C21718A|nr:EthD domain-containing protein [Burkholderia multivorans]MBU9477693.1 EthD domain-containing protein [Burkholderia multivorans]
MTQVEVAPVVKRNSLLKRNPSLSRVEFSKHYEFHHGPLAASQAGFRQFALRYVQNHVEDLPNGEDPLFDGVTMSTQVPRDNYSVGFFTHPDYGNVKEDEQYLFDIPRTVSVLGVETVEAAHEKSQFKALLLTFDGGIAASDFDAVTRVVLNNLDVTTASALGFHSGKFEYNRLLELWFEDESARTRAFELVDSREADVLNPIFLPVREVLIYGPEKPWRGA